MRLVDLRLRTVPISRYADAALPSGGLNTTLVALVTDVVIDGAPVVGYGFTSFGRFGQAGLIRERFGPRLPAGGARRGTARSDPSKPRRRGCTARSTPATARAPRLGGRARWPRGGSQPP